MNSELEPFSERLDELFAKLGLPNPKLQNELVEEWDELAGSPWVGRSRPLVVRGKTLIVEAKTPSTISLLRYGETALLETLAARFGEGVVTSVELVTSGR